MGSGLGPTDRFRFDAAGAADIYLANLDDPRAFINLTRSRTCLGPDL
jgi:hypothetical protein